MKGKGFGKEHRDVLKTFFHVKSCKEYSSHAKLSKLKFDL